MKKLSAMRLPTALVAVVLAVNGCANMDDKTTSAGIGAAVGCAAGAALAKLTKNDAGTACLAGAVVGGLIGYQRARSSEIQEAQARRNRVDLSGLDRAQLLSRLRSSGQIAARGLDTPLEEMAEAELRELCEEVEWATNLDEEAPSSDR